MKVITLFWNLGLVASSSAYINLGTAASFGALSGSTITNTGPTIITGDIGTAGVSITGFPPGIYTGSLSTSDTGQIADANTAYNEVAAMPNPTVLTGDLAGMTLPPGTYAFSTSASLSGTLILLGNGNSSDIWYFQIGSTLITGVGSSVVLPNSTKLCVGEVWWQVGSSATLGTGTAFYGNILAAVSITMNTGSSTNGQMFALSGAITLDSNIIEPPFCPAPVASSTLSFGSSTTISSSSLSLSTADPVSSSLPSISSVTASITTSIVLPPPVVSTSETPPVTQSSSSVIQTPGLPPPSISFSNSARTTTVSTISGPNSTASSNIAMTISSIPLFVNSSTAITSTNPSSISQSVNSTEMVTSSFPIPSLSTQIRIGSSNFSIITSTVPATISSSTKFSTSSSTLSSFIPSYVYSSNRSITHSTMVSTLPSNLPSFISTTHQPFSLSSFSNQSMPITTTKALNTTIAPVFSTATEIPILSSSIDIGNPDGGISQGNPGQLTLPSGGLGSFPPIPEPTPMYSQIAIPSFYTSAVTTTQVLHSASTSIVMDGVSSATSTQITMQTSTQISTKVSTQFSTRISTQAFPKTSLVLVTLQTTTILATLSVSKIISTSVVYVQEITTELRHSEISSSKMPPLQSMGETPQSSFINTQLSQSDVVEEITETLFTTVPCTTSSTGLPALNTQPPLSDVTVDIIETLRTTVPCTTSTLSTEVAPVPLASGLPTQQEGTPPTPPDGVPCKACKHGATNEGSNGEPNGQPSGAPNTPPTRPTSAAQNQPAPVSSNNQAAQPETSAKSPPGSVPSPNSASAHIPQSQASNSVPGSSNAPSKNGSSTSAVATSSSAASNLPTQMASSEAAKIHKGGLASLSICCFLALMTLVL